MKKLLLTVLFISISIAAFASVDFQFNKMGASYWQLLSGTNLMNGYAQITSKGYVDSGYTVLVCTITNLVPFTDTNNKLVLNDTDLNSLVPIMISMANQIEIDTLTSTSTDTSTDTSADTSAYASTDTSANTTT